MATLRTGKNSCRQPAKVVDVDQALDGVLKNAAQGRETAVREFIRRGSMNMPGFANAFTPTEFEELIAYLKTL